MVFANNGVTFVTATNPQGVYEIYVKPLSVGEYYKVSLSHPNFLSVYWEGDPSSMSYEERLARHFEYPEDRTYGGEAGGGGAKTVDFSLFPENLTEQESMQAQIVRPKPQ